MKNIRGLILIACLGLLAGIASVHFYRENIKPQQPLAVNYNPYDKGVYATGIVEGLQQSGQNINIYPSVSGAVTAVWVQDGQRVQKDQPLLQLDDSIQRALVAKDEAAVRYAEASLINLSQQLKKTASAYQLNPQSVSKINLENAVNAVKIQKESLEVARMQLAADQALLKKYTLVAASAGQILRVGVSVGDYASPIGRYDGYSAQQLPLLEMAKVEPYLEVRCFLDEILVPRLPKSTALEASLFLRGLSNYRIPLEFQRIQPYLVPNIQLSNQRRERVDVRVLPIIFRFKKPEDITIFPGQLVDIYIRAKA